MVIRWSFNGYSMVIQWLFSCHLRLKIILRFMVIGASRVIQNKAKIDSRLSDFGCLPPGQSGKGPGALVDIGAYVGDDHSRPACCLKSLEAAVGCYSCIKHCVSCY